MSNHDWGGGDWWEVWPPPPGESDDSEGTYSDDESQSVPGAFETPMPGDFLDAGEWELSLEQSGEIVDIRDFMANGDNINPADLRGIGFIDPGEALNWLESIGVLSFSWIYEIDDLWFPVIGDSDEAGGQ